MPEGRELPIAKGEYPKLDDMEENRPFSFSGEATVRWDGENGVISFRSFDIETENSADKELKGLRGTPEGYSNNESPDVEM